MSSSAEPRSTARRRIAGERGRSRATTDVPSTDVPSTDVPVTGVPEATPVTVDEPEADTPAQLEATGADEPTRQDAADHRGGRRRWVLPVAALVASLAALAAVLGLTLQDTGLGGVQFAQQPLKRKA